MEGPQYMVYVLGGSAPQKIHKDFDEAVEEAKRLCMKENKRVRVLEILGECVPIATYHAGVEVPNGTDQDS